MDKVYCWDCKHILITQLCRDVGSKGLDRDYMRVNEYRCKKVKKHQVYTPVMELSVLSLCEDINGKNDCKLFDRKLGLIERIGNFFRIQPRS